MNQIYTVGHSSHNIDYFLKLLNSHSISCLVDVRSTPYSKYTPQFNMREIKRILNFNKIYYIFMGNEFGARRKDKELYSEEGYLDFEKVSRSSLFISGMDRVKTGLEKGFNIALMCKERDPIDCHRNILVAREFHKQNYKVYNILEDSKIQNQEHIEKRLLDMYFPNRYQYTLFDNQRKNDPELINEAYKLRNKDIGYRLIEEKEPLENEVIYHRIH